MYLVFRTIETIFVLVYFPSTYVYVMKHVFYSFIGTKCIPLDGIKLCLLHFTEVRFASFFSGGFITAIAANQLERRLAKRTSVRCWKKASQIKQEHNKKGCQTMSRLQRSDLAPKLKIKSFCFLYCKSLYGDCPPMPPESDGPWSK